MFDWARRFARRRAGSGAEDTLDTRFVVLDTETSGLDPRADRVLSIGAVAVCGRRIVPGDGFHELIAQDRPSARDNILVHGIGVEAQRAGAPLAAVLERFDAWAGEGWRVGFHLAFDQRMLERAAQDCGRPKPRVHGWIDLAPLLPQLFPERGTLVSLDAWLGAFGVDCARRHDALADAHATALLLLAVLRRAADDARLDAPRLAAASEAAARLRAMGH